MACDPPFGVPSMMKRAPGCCADPAPGLLAVRRGKHRSHDESTHGVREDANGLLLRLGLRQLVLERLAQCLRGIRDRDAPVVRERHDLVRGGQVGAEGSVRTADESAGPRLRVAPQPGQPAHRQGKDVHPDGRVIDRQLGSHDARENEHHGLRHWRPLAVVVRGDRERLGLEQVEVGAAVRQRVDQAPCRVGPREVVEVRDLRAGVDPVAHPPRPVGAAEHRWRVDHQIVVLAIVQVGRERLEPAQDSRSFQVATKHVQIRLGPHSGSIQHQDEG